MDFFVDIIILPMLSYFQLLYDYFSLNKIISPYIIHGYLWLFWIIFGYFWLFHLRLLLVILSYFWPLKVISPYVITGNSRLL
jgi:hypothetical protein